MSTLRELGEFGLIRRLTEHLPVSEHVLTGIGDDCAVLEMGGQILLVTCDASVEDVHFRRDTAIPCDIGYKAAMSALSDLAAMGGQPRFALVTLACPSATDVSVIEGIYSGIAEAAAACGAIIVGGDTTQSIARIVIDLTVIGEPSGGRYVLRSGVRDGDVLAVTGFPGCSAAGMIALQNKREAPELVRIHTRPTARVAEGQWFGARTGVHAMIDLSDGLVQDVGHLCEASGVGADIEVDRLPISPLLQEHGAHLGLEALDLVLAGGEEYELVMALEKGDALEIAASYAEAFGRPLSIIGEFSDVWQGVRLNGEPVGRLGYDHFRA